MKKTSKPASSGATNRADLRPEYRFDYQKSQPNRFAEKATAKTVMVLLDQDVAKVFRDAPSVNTALRALMSAMPRRRRAG